MQFQLLYRYWQNYIWIESIPKNKREKMLRSITNECVDNLTELWLEINSQMDIVMARYLSHTYTHKNTHQQT